MHPPHMNSSSMETYGESFILCDGKMYGPSYLWWLPASPFHMVVALHFQHSLHKSPPGWIDRVVPRNHAQCGDASAVFGILRVWILSSMPCPYVLLPVLHHRSLTSIIGTTTGGHMFVISKCDARPPCGDTSRNLNLA
jgi:hypothetical protein